MPNIQATRSVSSFDFEHITAIQVPVVGGSMSLICVDTREDQSNTKDRGWAWIVCAGAFMIMFFTFGTHTCFGVLLSALLDHFQESKARTAWVGSISVNVLFVFSPITSRIAERYGVRTVTMAGGVIITLGLFLSAYAPSLNVMYLTYGLLFGIGTSLCGTMAQVVTVDYFDKHLSLATGIVASGSSVGTLVLAPFLQFLLGRYGWQFIFKLLAGMGILLAIIGLVFKPLKAQNSEPLIRRRQSIDYGSCAFSGMPCRRLSLFDCYILKNKAFLLWVVATSSAAFGYFIPHFFLIQFSEEIGIPRSKGSWLISYFGIASTVGRILFGKLSDVSCINNLSIYRACMMLIGLASALCPLAKSYEAMVVYVVVLGLLDGSYIGLMSIVTLEIVKINNIIRAWGILYFCQSFTYLLGPPAAGMMYDTFKSYKSVFFLAGGSMIFGATVLLMVPCCTPSNIQQMTNIAITTPNGTRIRPPEIIITDVTNDSLMVVERLTSL